MKHRIYYCLYCFLTQLIIILAWFREKVADSTWMQKRYDRTFYASTQERSSCCDCGLDHVVYPLHGEEPRDPAFRLVPIRIKDYKYRWRIGAGKSSPSVDESNLDLWSGKPK